MSFARVMVCSLLVSMIASGCVYDHRVTQAIQERRRRAREAEGAHISSGGPAVPARRVAKIRFYAADDYRHQHTDWKRRLEDMADAASGVLRPAFGVAMEASELHEWTPACTLSDLDQCLKELAVVESSANDEWVVGVLGADPTFTETFDTLGMANVPGHHFVVRDVSDLAERAAIDKAFATHTESRREEIYEKRKRHKRLAVFLHEWAHTLGACHTGDSAALMQASYDDRASHFDDANARLVTGGLDDRYEGASSHEHLLAALNDASAQSFLPGTRDRVIASLHTPGEASPAPTPQPPPAARSHPYIVDGSDEQILSDMAVKDRIVYRAAEDQLLAQQSDGALETLSPLVERYPGSYAVQHLACGLLMELGRAGMQSACMQAQNLAGIAQKR
jgi:hypothetical protein